MKSPIAPPRMTRMRPSIYCSGGPVGRFIVEIKSDLRRAATDRWLQRSVVLISREGKRENHAAVNQCDGMQKAPAKPAPCAPINLIPQHIRNGHPEQAGKNQQI